MLVESDEEEEDINLIQIAKAAKQQQNKSKYYTKEGEDEEKLRCDINAMSIKDMH